MAASRDTLVACALALGYGAALVFGDSHDLMLMMVAYALLASIAVAAWTVRWRRWPLAILAAGTLGPPAYVFFRIATEPSGNGTLMAVTIGVFLAGVSVLQVLAFCVLGPLLRALTLVGMRTWTQRQKPR